MKNTCTLEKMDYARSIIPQKWAREAGFDKSGCRCVYIQGSRFDRRIGSEQYCLAVARIFRGLFDPSLGGVDHDSSTPNGKITVLVDCRAGKREDGCFNPSPIDKCFLSMVR